MFTVILLFKIAACVIKATLYV